MLKQSDVCSWNRFNDWFYLIGSFFAFTATAAAADLRPRFLHASSFSGIFHYFVVRFSSQLKIFQSLLQLFTQFLHGFLCLLKTRFHCFSQLQIISRRWSIIGSDKTAEGEYQQTANSLKISMLTIMNISN